MFGRYGQRPLVTVWDAVTMARPEVEDLMLSLVVRVRTEAGGAVPEWFDGAVLALEAVGAISEVGAAEWRARAEREAREDEPGGREVASRGSRHRGRGMLEGLLAPSPTGRMRKGNEERFETLLAACEVASIFAPREIEGWLERFAGARGVAGPARRRKERPSAGELLAVVPGPAAGERELRVRWVELYADSVVVHWLVPVTLEAEAAAEQRLRALGDANPRLQVADEVGTEYAVAGGGGGGRESGAKGALAGRSVFAPGPAPRATRLVVFDQTSGDVHLSLALPA